MDFETLSFTKLFQTVCSVCLTIQTQFISCSSRGLRFHFNFLSPLFFFLFPMCRVFFRAQWEGEFRYSGRKKKKGHCLWRRTKTSEIAVTQPSLNTQFSDRAGSTVNGQLSCLIQQPERRPGFQGQHWNAS